MKPARALISVSDKTGVVELARGLTALGISIISSGGTHKALTEAGIPAQEISEVTGFPEILDGRVKTLNPKIHGGILAVRSKAAHQKALKEHGITAIDIVVVNLYPFEGTIARVSAGGERPVTEEVIENIDIGGVALLRAAAKNFKDVTVISDPSDYAPVLEQLKNGALSEEVRLNLAAKAFRHTAYYDALISGYLTREVFPETMAIAIKKQQGLRYGENPHQQGALYRMPLAADPASIVNARQIQGKELSYNNYLDLDAAWRLVNEFASPACAIIKHSNPCGCAESTSLSKAYAKALVCDPLSAFGGIIAFNGEVDETLAGEVIKLFTECVVAPGFTPSALSLFATKKNLRLLELPRATASKRKTAETEFRLVSGGLLVQDRDNALLAEQKPAAKRVATSKELESLAFAWKVSKHVKSNAIVLARGTQTVGVGAGQMSRIDSLMIAASKMKAVALDAKEALEPLVLASDAFFPFTDVVNESAKIGVKAIIQPGGSVRDADSIAAADEHSIAMVFTGMRHFKH